MNSILKNLALWAILGSAGSAVAAPILIPNGDFSAGNSLWNENNCCGSYIYSYPGSGGNPGGYGIINNSGGGGYGIWIANGDAVISLASLGLTAGKAYTFSQDMITLTPGGGNKAGVKIESWGSSGYISDSGDLRATTESAAWATYNFNYTIAPGATNIKVVPLWAPNASIGYDNFKVDNTPVVVQPVIPNGAFEIPGGASWAFFQGGGQTVNYPATGGNPDGCAVIDSVGKGAYAVMVANNNASMSLVSLGLTAGQTYTFQQDMKILAGTSIGGLKVEFVPTGTGDLYPAIIGSGTQWATYSFQVTIPLTCTQIQLVPLWGPNSQVAYDNFKILLPAPPGPPIATIKTGTQVNWAAASAVNTYQPQKSADNSIWEDLGTLFTGNPVTSVFEAAKSPYYQVLETTPPSIGNGVLNPGFETTAAITGVNPGAANWNIVVAPSAGASMTVAASSMGFTPHSGAEMLVIESVTPASGPVTAPNTDVRSDRFNVSASTSYTMSFYAANTVKVGAANPQFTLFFYDDFGGPVGNSFTSFADVGTAWTKVEKTFTTPAGAASVTVGWIQAMGAGNAWQWVSLIDDVSLPTPSAPGITSVLAANPVPAVEVSWTTLTGSSYQVKSSLDLSTWANFGTSVNGTGSLFSVVDPISVSKKFYRVLQTTP